MNIGWLIGLASSSLLFLFAFIFFSKANYKKRFVDDYDLRNHFPYEFNYESSFGENILGNIALILSGAFSLGLFACSISSRLNNGLLIAASISGCLFTLLFILLCFLPLKFMKLHMLFSVLLFVASFFTPSIIGFAAFKNYQDFKLVPSLVIFIICMGVALFIFAMVMNPRLSLNIKMEHVVDDNGKEHYVRPKYIIFAFTEWLLILSLPVTQILLICLLFVL